MIFTLAIDPITHDLDFDRLLVSGPALVAQRLRIRLERPRAGWVWDLRKGVPWRETVFTRPPRLGDIEAALKAEVAGTDGVLEIESFELVREDGRLEVRFSVSVDDGRLVARGGPDGIFISEV